SDFADQVINWISRACSDSDSFSGYSSSTTCTLVPPIPKELTPALRMLSDSQLRNLSFTKNGLFSKSMVGFGFLNPIDGGNCLLCNDSTVLIKPTMPAAAVRWPILLLMEPMAQ